MLACSLDDLHDARDVEWQHPAVGVAQHEPLGAGFLGRRKHRHREHRIARVPVEEVLRVEEHPPVLRPQVRDRVPHHRHALLEVGAQGLGHMQVPCLADQTDDLGARVEQLAEHLRLLGVLARTTGHAERGQLRVLERLLRRKLEELRVAGVRARPPALDVGEADLVEPVQDPQAVLHRVREVGLLRAVAKRRVVQLDFRLGYRFAA